MRAIRRMLAAMVIAAVAMPAHAQDAAVVEEGALARYITRVSAVTARTGGDAQACGLEQPEQYANKLETALANRGLRLDPSAATQAYLMIWVTAFGALDNMCAVFMSLRFVTNVAMSAIDLEGVTESERPLVHRYRESVTSVPAAFYSDWQQFVRSSSDARFHVDTVIDALVGKFQKARGS